MKWANGHFDKKVVSSSEQKTVPLDLLVTGSLPSYVTGAESELGPPSFRLADVPKAGAITIRNK